MCIRLTLSYIYFISFHLLHVISDDITRYNQLFSANIHMMKPLQYDAVLEVLAGNDCLCCLPTGYGKSLVYELFP